MIAAAALSHQVGSDFCHKIREKLSSFVFSIVSLSKDDLCISRESWIPLTAKYATYDSCWFFPYLITIRAYYTA